MIYSIYFSLIFFLVIATTANQVQIEKETAQKKAQWWLAFITLSITFSISYPLWHVQMIQWLAMAQVAAYAILFILTYRSSL